MMIIKIANKHLGENEPCFIIAEAGVNHDGDIEKAKKLIDIAKQAGADAVKFQTWITEEIVTEDAEQADYQSRNIGKKESQYNMLKRLELSFDNFKELKKYADKKDIIFLSTPDDEKSVDFLDKLGVVAFKIGSGELTNNLMLKKIGEKNKPIILSTGMANLEEVEKAVQVVYATGNKNILLLHCTSNYPTKLEEVNLKAMLTLKNKFKVVVGYSDHTKGIDVSIVAKCLGASIIEKHFTYNKKAIGPDHRASLNPLELEQMVKKVREIEKLSKGEINKELQSIKSINVILGNGEKKPVQSEISIAKLVRKSIVARRDVKKGSILTKDLLTVKRPNSGLSPDQISKLLNKKTKQDIKKDKPILLEMLE